MRWIVRLYPARWRERYEREFLAFLEDEGPLSPLQRLDLLGSLLDAHLRSMRARMRGREAPAQGTVRALAGAGISVLFTTSENGGLVMRRALMALLYIVLGLAAGLAVPYARQSIAAALSSAPPGYTAAIYQDVLPSSRYAGMTSSDIVNTGRDMPRLVVVPPRNSVVSATSFEAQRDHKPVLLHFIRLGHGVTGYSLGPLKHGQTATVRMWWRASGGTIAADLEFFGQVPHLAHGLDEGAYVREVRS
jgi:hypothetical protein